MCLYVPVKPRIDRNSFPPHIQIKAGQTFKIDVKYIGEPAPVAVWLRGEDEVRLKVKGRQGQSDLRLRFHLHTNTQESLCFALVWCTCIIVSVTCYIAENVLYCVCQDSCCFSRVKVLCNSVYIIKKVIY